MELLEYVQGEEVVFCPVEQGHTVYLSNRGADGVIEERQTTKSGKRVRVKSFLVKWQRWRKGKSCFRLKGRKRGKSDWYTALFDARLRRDKAKTKKSKSGAAYHRLPQLRTQDDVSRFEEGAQDIHPASYCSDCPLRLRRLVTPCDMSKKEAIEKYGKVE